SRRRHTRLQGDWSSDVCSSDLSHANGISAPLAWDEWIFINPELTIHLDRAPVGEWICLDAQTIVAEGGLGTAEAVLFDQRGRVEIGRASCRERGEVWGVCVAVK